jgi:hypothetical protein
MTTLSPINKSIVALQSVNKGSTYGKASSSSNPHSFQQPQRGSGSLYTNRTEVLSKEVTIYSSQSQSIIIVCEPTRDPTIT